MDAVARTRQLERSLYVVGLAFTILLFLSGVPFGPLVAGVVLIGGLHGCATASPDPAVARPLQLASLLVLVAIPFSVIALFATNAWLAATTALNAAALYVAVNAFSKMADWFGGVQRWRRARHEATVVAAMAGALAAFGLTYPDEHSLRLVELDGAPVAVTVVVIVATAAAMYGVFRISLAFRDLRLRVCAAVDVVEREGTLAHHG